MEKRMRFKSGKHEGMTTEQASLTEPDFAQWTIEQYPESPHGQAFIQHTRDFDNKPFTEVCHGKCGRKATWANAFFDGGLLFFWCDKCDPAPAGVRPDKLMTLTGFSDLLQRIDWCAGGNRRLKRLLVRQLAEAKGLAKRVGEAQALEFFSPAPTFNRRATELMMMVKRPACRWKRPPFPMRRRTR
jgi:hypothetical protein